MNKIYSVFFRYKSQGQIRVATRAVAAENGTRAAQKLLEYVRTRPGYCPECKRTSDYTNPAGVQEGHRKFTKGQYGQPDVPACTQTKWQSEADAEFHDGRFSAVYSQDDVEPQPPVTITIKSDVGTSVTRTWEQPHNKDNPCILR